MPHLAPASLVLASLILAGGCTPSEELAEQPQAPASTPAPAPAPVEAEPTPVVHAREREFFFGYVSQTGVEHCPEGATTTWLDLRSTLGFIPTSGLSLEPWLGKVVLAKGEAGPRPPAPAIEPAPCPIMQMRSDWRTSPRGIRIDRGGHPDIEAFVVASVDALPLEVVVEADELVVTFTNPLPFALAELGFTAHYEGCYGKPGSKHLGVDDQPLAPGESRSERFPVVAEDASEGPAPERKGGTEARRHLAHSIQLVGEPEPGSPPLHIDLEAPLDAFGIAIECPDQR